MKITNFADNGIPIALGGWSTGITTIASNANTADGGISAINFVQRITANGSNILLNPSVNFAAGSNITLAAASNTITITGSAGGGGGGFADPMTTRGDIIVRDSGNVTARLAKGAANTYLGSDGTDPSWSQVTDAKLSTSDITTNDATTSKHGFLQKLPGGTTTYLRADGSFGTPSGTGVALDDEQLVVAMELFL